MSFDINNVTKVLWLDASDESTITLVDTDKVSNWNDKSSNDRHATQVNSSNSPILVSNALNGKNGIDFNGSNQFFDITNNAPLSNNMALFVVFRRKSTGHRQMMLSLKNSYYPYSYWWENNNIHNLNYNYAVSGIAMTTADLRDGNFISYSGRNSSQYFLSINGAAKITANSSVAITTEQFEVLGRSNNDYSNMILHELILLGYEPSLEEQQNIESYLANKWDLTYSLPVDHPGYILLNVFILDIIPIYTEQTPSFSIMKDYEPVLITQHYYYGGTRYIQGTVTLNGQPVRRKVRLYSLKTGEIIAETWSDAITGIYQFKNLGENEEYTITAIDHERQYTPISHEVKFSPKEPEPYYINNIEFNPQSMNDPDYYKGDGRIWGLVTNRDNEPLERRIVLVESLSYIIVKQTTSSPVNGYYLFTDLNRNITYSIIAEDDSGEWNDIIRARVIPEEDI